MSDKSIIEKAYFKTYARLLDMTKTSTLNVTVNDETSDYLEKMSNDMGVPVDAIVNGLLYMSIIEKDGDK